MCTAHHIQAHFQLARLYEKDLNNTSGALEHYKTAQKYATGSDLAVVCLNRGVLYCNTCAHSESSGSLCNVCHHA